MPARMRRITWRTPLTLRSAAFFPPDSAFAETALIGLGLSGPAFRASWVSRTPPRLGVVLTIARRRTEFALVIFRLVVCSPRAADAAAGASSPSDETWSKRARAAAASFCAGDPRTLTIGLL